MSPQYFLAGDKLDYLVEEAPTNQPFLAIAGPTVSKAAQQTLDQKTFGNRDQ